MKKATLVTLLLLILSLFVTAVSAQDGTLAYGDVAEGEITSQKFEYEYSFEAKSGDVVILIMAAVDIFGDLDSPLIDLLDSQNNLVGSTANQFSFNTATLAIEIPADGTYLAIATRQDGRSGDSVGAFTFSLLNPPVIAAGTPVTGSVSSENEQVNYYVVKNDSPFSIFYTKTAGDYFPELKISLIDTTNSGLKPVGFLSGEAMTVGAVGNFAADTAYVVTVGSPDAYYFFAFDPVTADYQVELVNNE